MILISTKQSIKTQLFVTANHALIAIIRVKKLDFQKKIGKHLRKVRREHGISVRELELRSEIDRSLLSKIENGTQNPTTYTIHRICEALEITTEEFYQGFNI